MPASPFAALRRRLVLAGGRASDAPAESAQGRRDDASYRPARLIEAPLTHHPVGAPEPWREPVAFLDGTQHVELVGYIGTTPLVAAVVRAAVREREQRKLHAAVVAERRILVSRPEVLAQLDGAALGIEAIASDGDETPHPVRDLQRANAVIDRIRGDLEIRVAREFRSRSNAWLLIDGSLSASPDWTSDPRMIGVVKSHASLPFEADDLERYLTVPVGHRSSVFEPESHRVAPVHAWALRLHDFTGRDLFHGLVRIEVAADASSAGRATQLSRHLLAERAPLANDARADRLLYGIHDVERFLRAQGS
ncbi:MAG: hypothetical protein ABIZ70_00435 [Gemmatimonadales bacterium]